jgi:hypothetical protein
MNCKHLFVFFATLFTNIQLYAQLVEFGIQASALGSRFTVSENRLSEDVLVRQGRIAAGGTFGAVVEYGSPKDQPLNHLKLFSSLLAEFNFAYNPGKIELMYTTDDGTNYFNELSYNLVQSELSLKYLGKLKKFRFLLGPTFVYNAYRGVQIANGEMRDAGSQLTPYYINVEFGIGVRANRFMVSTRYNTNVTDFGKESPLIPTTFNSHQIRFVVGFYLMEKHRGKNWGSIYWD